MKNKKSRIRNKFQIQNHKWTRKINLKGKHHKEIRNTCYIFTNQRLIGEFRYLFSQFSYTRRVTLAGLAAARCLINLFLAVEKKKKFTNSPIYTGQQIRQFILDSRFANFWPWHGMHLLNFWRFRKVIKFVHKTKPDCVCNYW